MLSLFIKNGGKISYSDFYIALDSYKRAKNSRMNITLDVLPSTIFFSEKWVAHHMFSQKMNSEFSRICHQLQQV